MAFDFDRHLNQPVVAVFGEDVLAEYRRPYEPPFNIAGILTREHVEITFDGSGSAVSSRSTRFFCTLSVFPEGLVPRQGDLIGVGGGDYLVADIQPDAGAGVNLVLQARYDRPDPQP